RRPNPAPRARPPGPGPLAPPRRGLPALPPGSRRPGEDSSSGAAGRRPAGKGSALAAAEKAEPKPEEEVVNLTVFEHDRPFVIDALRQGAVDYLENVSEAAEANLFRHLIDRRVLERLAESYPSPREQEEVPVWFYLASQISLRLHGAPGYNAFPYVIRCGGLIDALGPEVGRKAVHPQSGDVTLGRTGFN